MYVCKSEIMLEFNMELSRKKHLQWVILWTLFGIEIRRLEIRRNAWKGTANSAWYLSKPLHVPNAHVQC